MGSFFRIKLYDKHTRLFEHPFNNAFLLFVLSSQAQVQNRAFSLGGRHISLEMSIQFLLMYQEETTEEEDDEEDKMEMKTLEGKTIERERERWLATI